MVRRTGASYGLGRGSPAAAIVISGQAARRARSVADRVTLGPELRAGGQPPRRPCREAAGTGISLMSWRIHRIRLAAVSGWSPNSCAIRLAQPLIPNRRTVRLITSASASGVGASDRCSPDANRAAHRASLTFNRVMTSLRALTTKPFLYSKMI
jgi:hypothetical protein